MLISFLFHGDLADQISIKGAAVLFPQAVQLNSLNGTLTLFPPNSSAGKETIFV